MIQTSKHCFVCNYFEIKNKHRIYKDDKVSAFLSDSPMTRGHSYVFWKDHILFSSLSKREARYLIDISTKISRALKKVFSPDSINRLNYNLDDEAPHAYFELVPIYGSEIEKSGFSYFIPKRKKTESFEELVGFTGKVRDCLDEVV